MGVVDAVTIGQSVALLRNAVCFRTNERKEQVQRKYLQGKSISKIIDENCNFIFRSIEKCKLRYPKKDEMKKAAIQLTSTEGLNIFVYLLELLENIIINNSAAINRELEKMHSIETENFKLREEIETLKSRNEEKDKTMEILRKRISDLEEAAETFNMDKISAVFNDFEALVLTSPYFVTFYEAHHPHFASQVVVVLWKSRSPGPSLCYRDKPVLYVYHHKPFPQYLADSWITEPRPAPEPIRYTSSEIAETRRVEECIERHQQRLFAEHSNLVAIRSARRASDNTVCIEFVVLCKHFFPIQDKMPLAKFLDDIPTQVTAGLVQMCGWREQQLHRPLVPGAAFALGSDALLNLNATKSQYTPPVLGTIGGSFSRDGVTYGVTCAHCTRIDDRSVELHPSGTPAYQPCAMGLLVGAAASFPFGLLESYDMLKDNQGKFEAMKWLTEQLQDNNKDFSADLPNGAQCGMMHRGILGQLKCGETADVALVQLTCSMEQLCNTSRAFPNLQSPPLVFGTDTLDVDDFPYKEFGVYGQGGRSNNIMKAKVNPTQPHIWFREVGIKDLVFKAVHAGTDDRNWQPGDSGTWCWTAGDTNKLVGMGIAYAVIDKSYYCCILPMAVVNRAIEELMEQHNP